MINEWVGQWIWLLLVRVNNQLFHTKHWLGYVNLKKCATNTMIIIGLNDVKSLPACRSCFIWVIIVKTVNMISTYIML